MVLKSVAIVLVVSASAASGESLAIDHVPVACMLAGRYPVIEAHVLPPGTVPAAAHVYFRADNVAHWSSIAMKVSGDALSAALPKPASNAREVYYYIEATDASAGAVRSPDYLCEVIKSRELCRDPHGVAQTVDSASATVETGPEVPLTHAKDSGGNGKWLVIGALGAGAAGAGIALAGHSSGATSIPSGTYAGTLDGYVQTAESSCFFWQVSRDPGTISITVTGSTGSASLMYSSYGVGGAGIPAPTCLPPAEALGLVVQFSTLTVSGPNINGSATVGPQTFVLAGTVANTTLQGTITITGGDPGFTWSSGLADFHAPRSP
jgi:hypothetical protein